MIYKCYCTIIPLLRSNQLVLCVISATGKYNLPSGPHTITSLLLENKMKERSTGKWCLFNIQNGSGAKELALRIFYVRLDSINKIFEILPLIAIEGNS